MHNCYSRLLQHLFCFVHNFKFGNSSYSVDYEIDHTDPNLSCSYINLPALPIVSRTVQ